MERRLIPVTLASVIMTLMAANAFGEDVPRDLFAVEAIDDPLPWPTSRDRAPGVRLALSKSRYFAEDDHLDVIVELGAVTGSDQGEGGIRLRMWADEGGEPVYETTFEAPSKRFVCYPRIPEQLIGRSGTIEVVQQVGEVESAGATGEFRVASPADTSREGRVELTIPNPSEATVQGLPQTVGVPFPRGALNDQADVRLVDGDGQEIPLQTKVTGRWSRFGSIRWLLCDFTVDLNGGPMELFLEYGPAVSRESNDGLRLVPARHAPLVPRVETGQLRFGPEGLAWDAEGGGDYTPVIGVEGGMDEAGLRFHGGLSGAFLEREDARHYGIPQDNPLLVEEHGPEKVVLKRSGWYVNTEQWGDLFCRFTTRYVIHRDSPMIRVFHTWIYTGDSNEDRIQSMGWKFPLLGGLEPHGLLTGFGTDEPWIRGQYLVQHDFDKADIADEVGQVREMNVRAPGVFAAQGNGTRVYFGVKDFWQNYPREVGFTDGAMVFYEWPRHGREQRRTATPENMMRLWFAHEGESLDFRLPEEYGQDPIHSGLRHEQYWPEGRPEAVNAQGVAKTTEFWLYLTDETMPPSEAAKVLQGLNDETLRAVVDPAWMAASGAFYEMHPLDTENYPEDEAVYELHAQAPLRWAERMAIYGKWVWGNMLWSPNLEAKRAGIYRGFRKAHQGWPYSWIPFARSGDARYLKFAEAATRTMTDVNFSHYSDEKTGHRSRGEWYRGALPWTGSSRGKPYSYPPGPTPVLRGYSEQADYHFHAYHLTGYARARDVIRDWAGLVKEAFATDGSLLFPHATAPNPRRTTNLLKTYVEYYQETFDPWFIMAAHVMAQREEPWNSFRHHFWQPGNREYHRFSGCDEFKQFYLDEYVPQWVAPEAITSGWAGVAPQLEQPAYAYHLTGDPVYLRRLMGWLKWTRAATYDGDPSYRKGSIIKGLGSTQEPNYTGYYLQQFPMALAAIEAADGERPAPLPGVFFQAPAVIEQVDEGLYHWRMPTIAVRKSEGEALPLRLQINTHRRAPADQTYQYTITGPDGEPFTQGDWNITEQEEVVIPAEHDAGVYRVQVDGEESYVPYGSRALNYIRAMRGLRIPISPPGTPEVVEFNPEEGLGTAFWRSMYVVHVPEDREQFEVTFSLQTKSLGPGDWTGAGMNRVAVWNPDDQPVWMEQHLIADHDGPDTVTAVIDVPPEHRGTTWTITAPGWSRGMRLDPNLPAAVAASPDRWFEP